MFRSHYFLSQSHCKETKLRYLDISQWTNIPLKAGNSLAAMGSEKSRFPVVRNQLIECVNTCPTANGAEAQRLPAGAPGHTLGFRLFGYRESLQTTGQETYWQLEVRPEEAHQQTHTQQETPSLGLACRIIFSQVYCADPFETDQLPPSTWVLISSYFHFKGLLFSPSTFVLFKKRRKIKATR